MSVNDDRVVAIAKAELGVRESPNGSNDGPRVRQYQSATGAYRAPWCASFVQWVLMKAGIGPVANRTAGAYYLGDYAHSHGWTIANPEPGCGVVYNLGAGHTGIVESVNPDGSFYAIEGNESNAVSRVLRHRNIVRDFIRYPGELPPPRKANVPRFEVVSSANGHARVVASWGAWTKVGPSLPRLLVKFRNRLVVRRRVVTVTKG